MSAPHPFLDRLASLPGKAELFSPLAEVPPWLQGWAVAEAIRVRQSDRSGRIVAMRAGKKSVEFASADLSENAALACAAQHGAVFIEQLREAP